MHPRLRENIWTIAGPDQAGVSTPWGDFQMPTDSAFVALTIRRFCTGHHDIPAIAERTGFDVAVVEHVIKSFADADMLVRYEDEILADQTQRALMAICRLWGRELNRNYIGNQFITGKPPQAALVGWMLEMYHYIRDFPKVIEYAAFRAIDPKLIPVLHEYADQEADHAHFVLDTLVGLGMTVGEVEGSTPLVSTRAISFLMRSLATIDPAAMLLIAALVEAQDFDKQSVKAFCVALEEHYGVPSHVFGPYFEHQRIDHELGHARLLEEHLDRFVITDRFLLDRIVNELHDLKHAFDLQTLEILDYYGNLLGRYLPRQPMSFAAIELPTPS